MALTIINDIAVDLCGNDFLEPYLRRQLEAPAPETPDTPGDEPPAPPAPVSAVRIVTDDAEGAGDPALEALCERLALPLAVLRCPHIVGTGMTGLTRRIAEGIYKGTYVHIRGCEARISVVHAVDVARAAGLCAGTQGTYTLTDGADPTIHLLADALAHRIGDKRVITIKPSWARLWYGRRYYSTLTSDHTAPCTFTDVFPALHPVEVTQYLRTHVYDEKSL